MAALSVGTTAVKLESSGSRLWVQNLSTNVTVYWSTRSDVSTSNGLAILPNGVLDVDNENDNMFKIFLVANAAGADVRWDVL